MRCTSAVYRIEQKTPQASIQNLTRIREIYLNYCHYKTFSDTSKCESKDIYENIPITGVYYVNKKRHKVVFNMEDKVTYVHNKQMLMLT